MFTYFVTSLLIIHLTMTNCTFICYNLIRLYSYLQIKLTTNKRKKIENPEKDVLDCLVGNTIITCDSDDENNLVVINESDFAVLISKGVNMVCFYPIIDEYNPEYEMSILQFVSVKIEIDSVEYDVKLRTPHYTFYIVDNELNVKWVRYYFQKYLNMSLPVDVKYKMTIVDENIQFIMLNEKESIVLDQDSYRLYLENQEQQQNEEDGEETQDEEPNEEPNDPDEISLERLLEIEEEIKAEQKQQQDEGDLDLDKIMVEFEKMNVDHLTVKRSISVDECPAKTYGWFNMFKSPS